MATHFSILAWRITWTEEPGGLQSMSLQRAGHDLPSEHTHSHMLLSYLLFCKPIHFLFVSLLSMLLKSYAKDSHPSW